MDQGIKENIKAVYNRYADTRNKSDRPDWKNIEREQILLVFQKNGCSHLLEIGCGTGQDSMFFKENGFKVQAIDLSEEHVKCCCENGIAAEEMDLHNMTHLSEKFDCIYSMNCFSHIPKDELRSALREAQRVLQSDGLFYLGVYGGEDFEGYLKKDYYNDERFFAFYPFNEYQSILEEFYTVVNAREVKLSDELMFHAFLLKK
ncbi:MAG: class I SAM-dependent methyltransferase [Candidatus Electrothrix sp. AR3]|nr:class I SAM-dependent methyltransferase [Candidatus Electrothrix sp. AR3]